MLVDHLEDCDIFSNFNYGFRSSQSTEDLLTAMADRIARIFDSSGNNRTVELDLSKAFGRVCHASLLHKLTSYRTLG